MQNSRPIYYIFSNRTHLISSNQGQRGHGRFNDGQGKGVEAFYKHSMVQDPWRELEENQRQQNQPEGN